MTHDSELPNDTPTYPGYYYVADGQIVRAWVRGTVGELKADLAETLGKPVTEIRHCNLDAHDQQLPNAQAQAQPIQLVPPEPLKALEQRGAGYRIITEALDTAKPAGMFMFHMLGAMAEFERILIAERAREGMTSCAIDEAEGACCP